MHGGDNDSTGCIAGSWYGALYGLKGVSPNNYQVKIKKIFKFIPESPVFSPRTNIQKKFLDIYPGTKYIYKFLIFFALLDVYEN